MKYIPALLIAIMNTAMAEDLPAPATYRVTEIPNIGGCAYDVNNRGQVVGEMPGVNGRSVFLWSAATGITDIGAAAGFFYDSLAGGINDAGQVVGTYSKDPTQPFKNAFFWDPARGAVDLPDLPGGDTYARATAINKAGQVTGFSMGSSGAHAVLWTRGNVMDLGDLPGGFGGFDGSDGVGLNDRGDVVGGSPTNSGNRAFLWTPKQGMVNLGVLPGFTFSSGATDINKLGQVVGYSGASPTVLHAFLWTAADGMVDLGELPGGQEFGIAQAINDRGQVVGQSAVAELVGGGYSRAVLWENGSIYDLNTLVDLSDPLNGRLLLTQARGINEQGQIVGCASNLVEGRTIGFLLTPTDVQRQ